MLTIQHTEEDLSRAYVQAIAAKAGVNLSMKDRSHDYTKGRKIGKEYTHKCRFGHTFQGSFGLTIEMPLPPSTVSSFSNIIIEPSVFRPYFEAAAKSG
jgi:hypothetical protein